jgi:hypothetical protein
MNKYAVITQDELEPEIRAKPGLTMATRNLETPALPKVVKKKVFKQLDFNGMKIIEKEQVYTSSYFRKDGTLVDGHYKGKPNNTKGDKKPKKKTTPQPKHGANPGVKADCKKCLKKISQLLEEDGFEMAKENRNK